MDKATRQDLQQWTGWIAGALTRDDYTGLLEAAGLADVEIVAIHRVHAHATSAIVRPQAERRRLTAHAAG